MKAWHHSHQVSSSSWAHTAEGDWTHFHRPSVVLVFFWNRRGWLGNSYLFRLSAPNTSLQSEASRLLEPLEPLAQGLHKAGASKLYTFSVILKWNAILASYFLSLFQIPTFYAGSTNLCWLEASKKRNERILWASMVFMVQGLPKVGEGPEDQPCLVCIYFLLKSLTFALGLNSHGLVSVLGWYNLSAYRSQ